MVDGQTINQLKQDIKALTEEVSNLKRTISELEKKTKWTEDLDSDKIQSLLRLLTPHH